ncbi:MM3350-like domain-containing protein [Lineolata rhizophorae]|uniref:MM3350-like domain-containing protein n=1 Tax=Lineolata rhizophorae TaxID=578093 RepID=A0A6A6P467_9PEZI|nr:MM3350-like domain-containing protein [Lineolata rhizophorae]
MSQKMLYKPEQPAAQLALQRTAQQTRSIWGRTSYRSVPRRREVTRPSPKKSTTWPVPLQNRIQNTLQEAGACYADEQPDELDEPGEPSQPRKPASRGEPSRQSRGGNTSDSTKKISNSRVTKVAAIPKQLAPVKAPGAHAASLSTKRRQLQHVKSEPDWNYLIMVTVRDVDNPRVSRLLSMPPGLSFDQVHSVLQTAFGWACEETGASHNFMVTLAENGKDAFEETQLLNMSDRPRTSSWGICTENEANWTLEEVYEDHSWRGEAKIFYEYDAESEWVHEFQLLGYTAAGWKTQVNVDEKSPQIVFCLGGEGHPIAEQCGGPGEWVDLKKALSKDTPGDPDGERLWYRDACENGGKMTLDPYEWHMGRVNRCLKRDGYCLD